MGTAGSPDIAPGNLGPKTRTEEIVPKSRNWKKRRAQRMSTGKGLPQVQHLSQKSEERGVGVVTGGLQKTAKKGDGDQKKHLSKLKKKKKRKGN